jgi:hypothetical protein
MTEHLKTFAAAVKALKPTGIIGVSTIAKAFDKEVRVCIDLIDLVH